MTIIYSLVEDIKPNMLSEWCMVESYVPQYYTILCNYIINIVLKILYKYCSSHVLLERAVFSIFSELQNRKIHHYEVVVIEISLKGTVTDAPLYLSIPFTPSMGWHLSSSSNIYIYYRL